MKKGGHPLYATWRGMRVRCLGKSSKFYQDYGGRGITIDPSWESFDQFVLDMGDRPPGASLERKNNDLGYSKENCIWATKQEQARNRRSSRILTFGGKTQTMIAWAEELGITYMALYLRIYRRDMPLNVALSAPKLPRPTRKGEANNKSKLTAENVRAARLAVTEGATSASQARLYGLTPGAMHNAITGKTWKHVA